MHPKPSISIPFNSCVMLPFLRLLRPCLWTAVRTQTDGTIETLGTFLYCTVCVSMTFVTYCYCCIWQRRQTSYEQFLKFCFPPFFLSWSNHPNCLMVWHELLGVRYELFFSFFWNNGHCARHRNIAYTQDVFDSNAIWRLANKAEESQEE